MGPIKIHITDDHAVFRHGLKAFIEKEDDMVVVSEASDGTETLERVVLTKPDVVLLDINIPGMSASTLARELTQTLPELARRVSNLSILRVLKIIMPSSGTGNYIQCPRHPVLSDRLAAAVFRIDIQNHQP